MTAALGQRAQCLSAGRVAWARKSRRRLGESVSESTSTRQTRRRRRGGGESPKRDCAAPQRLQAFRLCPRSSAAVRSTEDSQCGSDLAWRSSTCPIDAFRLLSALSTLRRRVKPSQEAVRPLKREIGRSSSAVPTASSAAERPSCTRQRSEALRPCDGPQIAVPPLLLRDPFNSSSSTPLSLALCARSPRPTALRRQHVQPRRAGEGCPRVRRDWHRAHALSGPGS